MSRAFPFGVAILSVALSACWATEEARRPVVDAALVRRASAARAWNVLFGERAVGRVVWFASDADPKSSVYVVRNLYDQDLGVVDALGRAYRFVPHEPDPAWVGTGTVAQGVQRILELDAPCRLLEVGVASGPGIRHAAPREASPERAPAVPDAASAGK